mgnify:CR=1 FL=1
MSSVVFSVQQIKYELLAYIKGLGGAFPDWYVGISADPERALFDEHRVRREIDPWIYKPALSSKATQTVVAYFRETLRTDGAMFGSPADNETFVFMFRKGADTVPALAD